MYADYIEPAYNVQEEIRSLRRVFKRKFLLPSFSRTLEKFGVSHNEQIALMATEKAASVFTTPGDIERMAFLYTFSKVPFVNEYVRDEIDWEEPFKRLNRSVHYCDIYSLKYEKYMIFGVIRALRSLPLFIFPELFAGTGCSNSYEDGSRVICLCFALFSLDRRIADETRMQETGGTDYGTLLIAHNLRGYDVSDYFDEPFIMVEPCTEMIVTHIVWEGDISIVNADYIESDLLLEDRITLPPT